MTDYNLLADQIKSLAEDEPNFIPVLSNASALIYDAMEDLNWAGFYLMNKGSLLLGPFQGKVACIRIALGKGVCGTAAGNDETLVVPNVHEFPGHIACDSASNSEIVVPIHKDGKVVGVLDIDSPNLNRFSEDLDFSIDMTTMPGFSIKEFDLRDYKSYIDNEFESLGLNVTFEISEKAENNNIKRGYIVGNAKEVLEAFNIDEKIIHRFNHNETFKVKLEVDLRPTFFAGYDIRFGLMPAPYPVRIYDIESLFAGKISAVLCRNWKTRVKGRDFFDYVFYLKNNVEVNLKCVEARIMHDGIELDHELTLEELKKLLCEKFDTVDFEDAKKDVRIFIDDDSTLDLWNADFFKAITQNLKASEKHIII